MLFGEQETQAKMTPAIITLAAVGSFTTVEHNEQTPVRNSNPGNSKGTSVFYLHQSSIFFCLGHLKL